VAHFDRNGDGAIPSARTAVLEALCAEQARQIEALRAELEDRSRTIEATLESIPEGVLICDERGKVLHANGIAEEVLGTPAHAGGAEGRMPAEGIFLPDGKTPFPALEMPLSRALRGETVMGVEMFLRSEKRPSGVFLSASARPLRSVAGPPRGAVGIFRDVSERVRWRMDLEQRLTAEREKNAALERLRMAVQELSTPILEVWDSVLALPVVGVVDSHRSAMMMDRLLSAVADKRARFVIVDVTGVDVVDTATADRLLKLVGAVELLGARCVLTGIRPAVAQTLVHLGLDLGTLPTLRNLKHALRACVGAARLREPQAPRSPTPQVDRAEGHPAAREEG
jgi:rsbT co-antagonist protein RsbR